VLLKNILATLVFIVENFMNNMNLLWTMYTLAVAAVVTWPLTQYVPVRLVIRKREVVTGGHL
jgi:hypothetical protein